uniref:Late endosomal/lysosomal adaptor and MAPK and MTOR activator 1 n=1 Tax=Loa loa TaxID=7209 RepID=A0A1I7V6X5_LOALO
MGCRFSRTNDTEPENDPDCIDLPTETINQPLLDSTDHYFVSNSKTISMLDTTKVLNRATVSVDDDDNNVKEMKMKTATNCIKNAYLMAQWDMSSVRSTFCNRITFKPRMPLNPDVQETNTVYVNKPIKQIESASQVDFFRMLDEKIAQVKFSTEIYRCNVRIVMPDR